MNDRRQELLSKPMSTIHQETAILWSERAVTAFSLFLETRQKHWILDGEEYYHEALEHAALVSPELAAAVQGHVENIRTQALLILG